jgi:SAM-dependent methyltransferase
VKRDFLWPQIRTLPYFRGLLRAVEASLMNSIRLPRPVIDIGCGDGHFASEAFDEKLTVGIDPSLVSLREAANYGAYDQLLACAGEHLPFADGAFASAVSNSVLEHIPALQEVLGEVGRVVRPGGKFAITVPNPGYLSNLAIAGSARRIGLRGAAETYTEWFRVVTRTVNLEWEEEWKLRLERAGFELVRAVRYFPPRALRALEWGHYFGFPSLVARKLTGRWILSPTRANLGLTERFVRRYYREPLAGNGTYTFILARRKDGAA